MGKKREKTENKGALILERNFILKYGTAQNET